jgi:predicted DNA-binding protein
MKGKKPMDRIISMRLPEEIFQELKRIAEKEVRPISSVVRLILIDWYKKRKKGAKDEGKT